MKDLGLLAGALLFAAGASLHLAVLTEWWCAADYRPDSVTTEIDP